MMLPYRDNVGALLFNAAGQVLVARRAWPSCRGWPCHSSARFMMIWRENS